MSKEKLVLQKLKLVYTDVERLDDSNYYKSLNKLIYFCEKTGLHEYGVKESDIVKLLDVGGGSRRKKNIICEVNRGETTIQVVKFMESINRFNVVVMDRGINIGNGIDIMIPKVGLLHFRRSTTLLDGEEELIIDVSGDNFDIYNLSELFKYELENIYDNMDEKNIRLTPMVDKIYALNYYKNIFNSSEATLINFYTSAMIKSRVKRAKVVKTITREAREVGENV